MIIVGAGCGGRGVGGGVWGAGCGGRGVGAGGGDTLYIFE